VGNKFSHFPFLLTSFFSCIFDQITKYYFTIFLERYNGNIDFFNFFSLTFVKNYGILFGFFNNDKGRFILILFSIFAITFIFLYSKRFTRAEKYHQFSLGLIEGGIMGNLIDRIKNGYVIDFINFHFWPVFNFADSFIVIGIILFFIKQLRS
jgi:signal peptidase II